MLVVMLVAASTLSSCGYVPRDQVSKLYSDVSEQQHRIEEQQEQIDELVSRYERACSRQDTVGLERRRLTREVAELDESTTGQDCANVTMSVAEVPSWKGRFLTWRTTMTETNGVGATFYHLVLYYRVFKSGEWSKPQDVDYYDQSIAGPAWPVRLSANSERTSSARLRCSRFSEERHYTSLYFGRDVNGNDVIARGTVVVNGRKG